MHEELDRLARTAGIAPDYWDALGGYVRLTDESKRVLLQAMNIACETDDEIAASLAAFETVNWRRAVPNVIVQRVDWLPVLLSVVMPEDFSGEVVWRVHLENGATSSGRVQCARLSVGERRAIDGHRLVRRRLEISIPPEIGYHRIEIGGLDDTKASVSAKLIVVPGRCYVPSALDRRDGRPYGRTWGVPAQVYALRSKSNWGMGDFADLGALARVVGGVGGGVLGVNPLHALFLDRPWEAGPYSPSSRVWLNPLYISLPAVPEYAQARDLKALLKESDTQTRLEACRAADSIDYGTVVDLKVRALRAVFEAFREKTLTAKPGPRGRAFLAFCEEGGSFLDRFATFQALCVHIGKGKPAGDWRQWPVEYRHPMTEAVDKFRAENEDEILFHKFLQFEADRQLADVAAICEEAGMDIGLYRDLAVGVSPDGAEAWGEQEAFALGVSVGAPPDALNQLGQDWGLPPFNPVVLKERDYEPFIRVVRANMRHAGALRLDHVMGLMRQFWVPRSLGGKAGGYTNFPFDDLLGIIALESHRHRCLVIGEDLGTVPEGFRDHMEKWAVLSFRTLYFERGEAGRFKAPEEFPDSALAVVSTHDLATLRGYWRDWDLNKASELDLYPTLEAKANAYAERRRDRGLLLDMLDAECAWPVDVPPHGGPDAEEVPDGFIEAVYRHLAWTPCMIALVQLEDLLGQLENVNIPGTVGKDNWSRKLPLGVEVLSDHPLLKRLARTIRDARWPRHR